MLICLWDRHIVASPVGLLEDMNVISRFHVNMKTSFDFAVLRISTKDELSQLICILLPFQYFPHILHAVSIVNSSNAFICNSRTDMNYGKLNSMEKIETAYSTATS